MYSYKIKFLALNDIITFELSSPELNGVDELVKGLLTLYIAPDENGNPLIISLQKMTDEFRAILLNYFDDYKDDIPELNGLIAFLNKLEHNEYYYFLPNLELNTIETVKLHNKLRSLSENISLEKLNNQSKELFNELLNNYNFEIFGQHRVNIGTKNKRERNCRFCRKSMPETTFNSKAHAISEALGNKSIVLFEECDNCNSKFSKSIESDIVTYLSIFRTVYNIKGKSGSKKFKGKNFKLTNDEKVLIELTKGNTPDINKSSHKLKLESGHSIVHQNIYKALCKFYISTIPSSELTKFTKTIEWINGDYKSLILPDVAEIITYKSFTTHPKLTIYTRKNNNYLIPYAVGEFNFTCKKFVFIVPFSSMDNKTFTRKADYNAFWSTFKHLHKLKDWNFNQFSNDSPKIFNINLNFQTKSDKGAST